MMTDSSNSDRNESTEQRPKRRVIPIGSQRPEDKSVGKPPEKAKTPLPPPVSTPVSAPDAVAPVAHATNSEPSTGDSSSAEPDAAKSSAVAGSDAARTDDTSSTDAAERGVSETTSSDSLPPDPLDAPVIAKVPPRIEKVTDDLQAEIDAALGGVSLDDLMGVSSPTKAKSQEPQVEKRYRATVVKIHRDDVFFSLADHYEGVASVRQFDKLPEVGDSAEVVVRRHNADEGLYELSVPGASMDVQDWSDITPGMVVEAKITAHNSGGLECEVNGIRGFIPVSQIAVYRVEDMEQFVGEKFNCVISEANEARGNLVLSRRAVLEREREQAKTEKLQSLSVGQTHEGIVRSLRDFGAFVDIGGVDGLIHISKLSWDRIKHPSEVLEEGQKVKVKIDRFDEDTGKIGLSYRDLVGEHPWESAATRFPEQTITTGVVSKIMDFGAFIRLAPGVEGLAHISELAHHRVAKVSSVVQEGEEVTVKVLSIDPEAQRMSLSIKAAQAAPASASPSDSDEAADEPPRESVVKKFQGNLRGGTDRTSGGEHFGLNW